MLQPRPLQTVQSMHIQLLSADGMRLPPQQGEFKQSSCKQNGYCQHHDKTFKTDEKPVVPSELNRLSVFHVSSPLKLRFPCKIIYNQISGYQYHWDIMFLLLAGNTCGILQIMDPDVCKTGNEVATTRSGIRPGGQRSGMQPMRPVTTSDLRKAFLQVCHESRHGFPVSSESGTPGGDTGPPFGPFKREEIQ